MIAYINIARLSGLSGLCAGSQLSHSDSHPVYYALARLTQRRLPEC